MVPKRSGRGDRHYDLILIGSGMGALTVGSLMAQLRGKRVLVLERHFKAGGFTHSFRRNQFQWDPGIHYVGDMQPGSTMSQLLGLVTGQGVEWTRMAEPFEQFVYPDFSFPVYGDPQRYQADLIKEFPQEKVAICRYFQDVSRWTSALALHSLKRQGTVLWRWVGFLGRLWNRVDLTMTTQVYLDRYFRNPQLKALVTSQWGDYGMPPAQSPFAVHATIVQHYLRGAYYPVGGPGRIAECVRKIVEDRGGQFLLNREVTRILGDRHQVTGVRVRRVNETEVGEEEEFFAPVVVSNAGAVNTYLKLVPPEIPIRFRAELQQFSQRYPGATNIALYLGLKADPRHLGFEGENHWIYGGYDHNQTYAHRGDWITGGTPMQVYLSFPSLKDPEAKGHTAEIITFTDYKTFQPWEQQPWLRRDGDYKALKERLAEKLIGLVEHHYPGFAEAVEYCEVSTPLTNEHFTAHPGGSIYGLPLTSERLQKQSWPWTRVTSPLSGLYLTGVDLLMGGLVPAMFSGILTVNHLPDGIGLVQVFTAARR